MQFQHKAPLPYLTKIYANTKQEIDQLMHPIPTQSVMIIGLQKSGRSTIQYLLQGIELKMEKVKKVGIRNKIKLTPANSLQETPQIKGNKLEKFYKQNGTYHGVIYTLPNFGNGEDQIINAYIIQKYINICQNPKFLLIIDYNDIIADNPTNAISLMKTMDSLIGQHPDLLNSVLCLINKVQQSITLANIQADMYDLQTQIPDKEFKKYLLHSLLRNKNIMLFYNQKKEGILPKESLFEISQRIESLNNKKQLNKIYNIGKSRAYSIFIEELTKKFKSAFINIIKYFQNSFDFNKLSIYEIKTLETKLREIQKEVDSTLNQANNLAEFSQNLLKILNLSIGDEFISRSKTFQFLRKMISYQIFQKQYFKKIFKDLFASLSSNIRMVENKLNTQRVKKQNDQLSKDIQLKSQQDAKLKKQIQVKRQLIFKNQIQHKKALFEKQQQLKKLQEQTQKKKKNQYQQKNGGNFKYSQSELKQQQQKKHAEQLKRNSEDTSQLKQEDTSQLKQAAIRQEQQMLQLRRINQIQRNKCWLQKLLESIWNAFKQFIS